MAKWEYRVLAVRTEGNSTYEDTTNEGLRALTEDGYRYIETIYPPHSAPLLLFKRPGGKAPGKSAQARGSEPVSGPSAGSR